MVSVVNTDLFIHLIATNRIIFDKRSEHFKNKHKKADAWAIIAKQSRMTGKVLMFQRIFGEMRTTT